MLAMMTGTIVPQSAKAFANPSIARNALPQLRNTKVLAEICRYAALTGLRSHFVK